MLESESEESLEKEEESDESSLQPEVVVLELEELDAMVLEAPDLEDYLAPQPCSP